MLAFRSLSSRNDFVFFFEPEALADLQNRLVGNRLAPFDVALFLGFVCHWLSQLHPGIRMQLGKASEPE